MTQDELAINENENDKYLNFQEDTTLSLKASGFLARCICCEAVDFPTTSIKKLSQQINVSAGASYKIIKELIQAGYVVTHTRALKSEGFMIGRQIIYMFFYCKPDQAEVDSTLSLILKILGDSNE